MNSGMNVASLSLHISVFACSDILDTGGYVLEQSEDAASPKPRVLPERKS